MKELLDLPISRVAVRTLDLVRGVPETDHFFEGE